ncbi:MAG: hypothetical protein CMB56_003395 [Methanobacteriota archaeon]|nr:MAG: hypothetical protein CMB56_003395 [Euryarchaeota archaeon]|tara:strand:+ start:28059 stop:28988 length:930 start_codon:yes stop_codon:yes gene_type:complete
MAKENNLNPYSKMKILIEKELNDIGLDCDTRSKLLKEIPSRWEKLGDMVLVPELSFYSIIWDEINLKFENRIWKIICGVLNVSKVGKQMKISKGRLRKSQVRLLFGEDGIVLHKENGVFFEFDTTKVMFSSGNVSERIRVSKFNCNGEIILDLYSGIGYYSIPILVYSNPKSLHACEINPDSIIEFKKNLKHNNVHEKCTLHEGDNNLTVPKANIFGKVNRVILGLLPSSEKGWHLAIKSLTPNGGMLHLHGNAEAKKEDLWAEEVIFKLEKISRDLSCNYQFKLIHIEKVKSYAPRVNHIVLDILVIN